MAPTIEEIVNPPHDDDDKVEWMSTSEMPWDLKIYDSDPTWPQTFRLLKTIIVDALGPTALAVEHAGSTSIPGLPAKRSVDIDLTVPDSADEATYVSALEAAGFHFILREPLWNEHRLFRLYEPMANLHVFGPDAPEPVRHRIFREWLMAHPEDLKLYAEAKKKALAAAIEAGEDGNQYNARKEDVILDILQRAFRSLGYLD